MFRNKRYLVHLFLLKFLEDITPFCGSTDAPVLDFWWHLLWFSKPEWAALFTLSGGIYVTHSLRFTSGATPADLLAVSMAAKRISSTYLWAGIGGAQNQDLLCHRRKTLYRLSYASFTRRIAANKRSTLVSLYLCWLRRDHDHFGIPYVYISS